MSVKVKKKVERKQYPEEYKQGIVARILAGEKYKAIAEAEGIKEGMLYTWKKKYGGGETKVKEIKPSNALKDVVFYLNKAVKGMDEDIRSGLIKKEKEWHLCLKLALIRLTG